MKKAIFFDMDGVLVDSVEGNFLAWQKVLSDNGLDISVDELKLYEGMKSEFMVQEILSLNGMNLPLEKICEMQKEKRRLQSLNHTIEPYQIYERLLEFKEGGIKLYVVSGSPRDRVRASINSFFPGIFDYVISADDVSLGKPHPEPYLKAMNFSGFEIEDCLIVENAPLGIRSGKNGGFDVIALGTTIDREHLEEADYFVQDHNQLFDLVQELLAQQNLLE